MIRPFRPNLATQEPLTNFHGDEAKFFFSKIISKWLTQKNLVFQNRQFSIFFQENFTDWSLG
jgi:hypothetical protein